MNKIASRQELEDFHTWLSCKPAQLFRMRSYIEETSCGTCACIDGFWSLFNKERPSRPDLPNHLDVFYLQERGASCRHPIANGYISLSDFDTLPADLRKAIMLEVVQNIINFSEPRWQRTLINHIKEDSSS